VSQPVLLSAIPLSGNNSGQIVSASVIKQYNLVIAQMAVMPAAGKGNRGVDREKLKGKLV